MKTNDINFWFIFKKKRPDFTGTIHFCDFIRTASKAENGRQKSTNSREESKTYMISKKKIWHNGNSVRRGSRNASRFGCTGACRGDEQKRCRKRRKNQADAPATQSETENGNTEEAVVPAVETQETETPAEEPSVPSQDENAASTEEPEVPETPETDRGSDSNGDTGRPESRRDAGAISK